MELYVILLFLLWTGVDVSLSDNACSALPRVPHAYMTEATSKAKYQEGDIIHFTCETGYTSSLTIKYVCLAVSQGSCHRSASDCDPPPVSDGLIVKGLPGNNGPILPDNILTFGCDSAEKHLQGSSVLVCGEDGKWNNAFPYCKVKACGVGEMHPYLFVAGLPPSKAPVKIGHKLRFKCDNDYEVDGSSEIECLHPGEWNASFPTCSEKCEVTEVPGTTSIITSLPGSRLRKGETLRFECPLHGQIIHGSESVECLGNGQWNDSFPTCGAPLTCRNPTHLLNGDIVASVSFLYNSNERVEYSCQRFYTMEGEPYMTCINGEWIGEIKCLKPCFVDQAAMNAHDIQFRYSHDIKLYLTHGEYVTFACTRGRADGNVAMHQRWDDGVLRLPTCV